MTANTEGLEVAIRELTKPINGQFPRPWMTSLKNPNMANVFTVGKNQRHGFDVSSVGSHDHFVETLFNRGSETCRSMYERITVRPSPTRENTDNLVRLLADRGVIRIIETNVICYSTPMSADLRTTHHLGGVARGTEIFRLLLNMIKPQVIIAHGADSTRKLGKILGCELPQPPSAPTVPKETRVGDTTVFVIPSLAPPAFNLWSRWAQDHLVTVSERVAELVRDD